MEALEVLQSIGLSKAQSEVFYSLSRSGSSPIGLIKKETRLHKSTIYLALENLQKKGIVSYIIKGKTKIWHASSPGELVKFVQEKEKRLQEVCKDLIPIKPNNFIAEIYEGKEGLKKVFRMALEEKEYYHLLPGVKLPELLDEYFNIFQNRKKQLKAKAYILLSENSRNKDSVKKTYGNKRFLPESFNEPVSTMIFGNIICITVWADLVTFMIKSEETSRAYKKYFDTLWVIAKK